MKNIGSKRTVQPQNGSKDEQERIPQISRYSESGYEQNNTNEKQNIGKIVKKS